MLKSPLLSTTTTSNLSKHQRKLPPSHSVISVSIQPMCTMYMNLIVSLAILLTLSSAAIVEPLKQNCVLENGTRQVCQPSLQGGSLVDGMTSRMTKKPRAPCRRKDVVCWCKKSLEYTNEVRKGTGKKMLKLGSKRQMHNAMRYARKLSGMGYLKHQNLRQASKEVGCQRWVGGENLAFNYEFGDIARMCVDQWIGSRGHYENLIRSWFEEMVVGFHFDKDGRVYCVQTFALLYPYQTFGNKHGRNCVAVGTSS